MRTRILQITGAVFIVIACAAVSILLASKTNKPETKTFHIKARQYAYDPPTISVSQGDTVHIKLTSMDVVHGFSPIA